MSDRNFMAIPTSLFIYTGTLLYTLSIGIHMPTINYVDF